MSSFEDGTDEVEQENLLETPYYREGRHTRCRVSLALDIRTMFVDDVPVRLSQGEVAVLDALLDHQGTPLTRERILRHAGTGFGPAINPTIVDVFVCTLGRKFRNAGRPGLITTVREQGYMITGVL